MHTSPQTTRPEPSRAFTIILERLYALARQTDPWLGDPADLEASLTALPTENRGQVMLVLESVESRAQARADAELAEAARVVRHAARRVWAHEGYGSLRCA
jgi:hypothetical protein